MPNPRRQHNRTDHAHPGPPPRNVQHYPLGTREDVQQDDYESPIASMFTRAYDRHFTAEERRATARQSDSLANLYQDLLNVDATDSEYERARNEARAGAQAFLQTHLDLGEIDTRERENMLWGVPPPVANLNPLHGSSLPAYGLARRHGFHRQFYGSATSTRTYTNPFLEQAPRTSEPLAVDGPNIIDLQRRPPPIPKEELQVDFACKICQEQKIDTVSLPCMHAAVCHFCADVWRQSCYGQDGRFDRSLHTCVICRKLVKESRRFYLQ